MEPPVNLSDFVPFDPSQHLTDDEMIMVYLELALADPDPQVLLLSVSEVVKALKRRLDTRPA